MEMNYKKVFMGGAFVASIMPGLAFAAMPQKHSDCEVQINEPDNSSGYYMSANCKTAYVLPPEKGDFKVKAYTATVSNIDCDTLTLIEDTNFNNQSIENSYAKSAARKARKLAKLEEMIENGDIPEGSTEDEILDEIDEILEKIADNTDAINGYFKNYVEKKGTYAVMEGGVGTFTLTSGYAKLMEDFKKLNKDKGLNFTRIPLKKTRVSMVDDRFKEEKNRVEMKAVKRLIMAAADDETLPKGPLPLLNSAEAVIAPEKADNELSGVQEAIFGGAISGRIETSAIGHCAVDRANEEGKEGSLEAYIAARGIYEYELQVNRQYSVTYNFKELVHIIRESSKKGGFFSSKTVNKLIENRETSSWLKFHDQADDTSFVYTDEDIKEIKKEFLDRALRQIIDIRTGGKASALALLEPSKNGSTVIGEELQKCPHLYCQIGAAGFRILGAIFGSSKATSEVIKKLDADIKETRTSKRPVTFVGTSTF